MSVSIDKKIGALICAGFKGTTLLNGNPFAEDIKKHYTGCVWLTDNDSPMGLTLGNIESPIQVRTLTDELRRASGNSIFIAIDAEGGKVIRLKEQYGFPKTFSARELGEKDDVLFTRNKSEELAKLLASLGINFNLAPVVDLGIHKDSPAIGKKDRCFSDNPEKVYLHAKEFILAHKKYNIAVCLKHFPGHGSAFEDTHKGFVDATESWNEKELIPYQKLINEGLVDAVMSCHVFNSNLDDKYPATLSKKILTGLLRDKLGFEGIIFSDDMNMKAISENYDYETAIELAINAGVDILIQGNARNFDKNIVVKTHNIIKKLLEMNHISEQRIDESFTRINNLKKRIIK